MVAKVLSGERPERPKHPLLTDDLWGLTQKCWLRDPRQRPEIGDVVHCLRSALDASAAPSGTVPSGLGSKCRPRFFPRFMQRFRYKPRRIEPTVPDHPDDTRCNPPRPRSFLQRARIWLLSYDTPSAQNARHAIPVQLGGKRRTVVPGVCKSYLELEARQTNYELTITIRQLG